MANTLSLADYLAVGPPDIPTNGTKTGRNTTHSAYSSRDITSVNIWSDFTYAGINKVYGGTLSQAQIDVDPTMATSPQQPINSEPGLAGNFTALIRPRVRRALRVTFQHLAPQLTTLDLTPLVIDVGNTAQIVDHFLPDISFIDGTDTLSTKPNRCPGDLKVSWKWDSAWVRSTDAKLRREYNQVLAQVNFYMKQHRARYGFVLTDTELVPIKRLDTFGNLLVARRILWEAAGPGRLTASLALWYLGMLAASNDDWQLP